MSTPTEQQQQPVLESTVSRDSTLSTHSRDAKEPTTGASADKPLSSSPPHVAEPTDKQVEVPGAAAPPAGGPPAPQGPGAGPAIPMSRGRFVALFASMMLAVFLFALDQLIVSTAIPKIVSQFNSLSEVAWLSNGFFMTLCGFTLLYSQMLSVFPSKWVFLAAIFIFEVGSLVCGVAPSMDVLIFGRCLAGVGAAGIFSSAFQTVVEITTMRERSTYMGLFGACFGLSSVLGPLVGGALTDHVTWRWCFYINLPLGAVSFALIFLLLDARPALGAGPDSRPLWKKIAQLDWVGAGITIAFATILCLALQYGGVQKSWDSGAVIALLVMIPVSFGVLVGWTLFIGPDRAMLPLRFLKRQTVVGAAGASFFGWGVFMAAVQYLAIEYQAVDGRTATESGVDLLSMICVQTVLIVAAGKLVQRVGRYKPFIVGGIPFTILGSGLIYWAIKEAKPRTFLLGFQVLIGVGVAGFLQQTILSVQVEFRKEPRLIARAVGTLNFFGFIGRIVGISGATSIFNNLLRQKLSIYAPELPAALIPIVRESITSIRSLVPEASQPGVIQAYRQSIAPVFLFAIALGVVAWAFSILITNGSTHSDEKDSKAAAASGPPADIEKGVPAPAEP